MRKTFVKQMKNRKKLEFAQFKVKFGCNSCWTIKLYAVNLDNRQNKFCCTADECFPCIRNIIKRDIFFLNLEIFFCNFNKLHPAYTFQNVFARRDDRIVFCYDKKI